MTREQAERVKKLYESRSRTGEGTAGTVKAEDRLREQTAGDVTPVPEQQPGELASDRVFGRNIFNTRNLTFEPSVNLATPPNYRLGSGDEVNYGGTYTLDSKSERLSDPVRKAGGVTRFGYVKGAKLVRRANAEEKARMAEVIRMIRRETGIRNLDSLNIRVEDTFTVGINLEEALSAPGSDADVVLREGDYLTMPEYDNTVKIAGAVMYLNTVVYDGKGTFKDYLGQAGGYANNAKKRGAFIVYMNGQVAEVKGSGRKQIEPGCQIIVPAKMKRQNMANILGTVSSFGTVAMTMATIANLIMNNK